MIMNTKAPLYGKTLAEAKVQVKKIESYFEDLKNNLSLTRISEKSGVELQNLIDLMVFHTRKSLKINMLREKGIGWDQPQLVYLMRFTLQQQLDTKSDAIAMMLLGHGTKDALQDAEIDMEDRLIRAADELWEKEGIWIAYEVTEEIDLPY